MNLTRIFRRHSRTLLMVFMALLLVAFLVPSSISSCDERKRIAVAKRGEAFGKVVSTDTLDAVRADLMLLASARLLQREDSFDSLDYYLMTQEAERMGLRVGRDEVIALLKQRGQADELLQNLQRRYRRSYEDIYDTIGRLLAVSRMMNAQRAGVYNSLPRQRLAYRDENQQAVVHLSAIDDRAFLPQVPEPTEEQLQAFFEAGKDRTTAHTDDELVFGYRLPDRVQVEYLTVDPQKVIHRIQVKSNQIKQFFEDNAHRYTKPDPLATQPAEGEAPTVPMTFDEARDEVREDLRRTRAIEAAAALVNDMYNEAHRPWSSATLDGAGFPTVPEDKIVSFEALRDQYSSTGEVEYSKAGLLDAAGIRALPGLGSAGLGSTQARLSAALLAFRVPGLLDKDPGDRIPVLALGEPAPVLMASSFDQRSGGFVPNQAYLFRVVQVAPSGPPASLDEVREQVVKDWKLSQAHELARQAAQKLADRAKEIGLEAAIAEDTALKDVMVSADVASSQPVASGPPPTYAQNLGPVTPPRFTRQDKFLPRVGALGRTAEVLFGLGSSPVTDTSPAHRVALVQLANQSRWVVGEFVEFHPLYEGAFEKSLVQSIRQPPPGGELEKFGRLWSAEGSVRQRTGFRSFIEAADQPDGP